MKKLIAIALCCTPLVVASQAFADTSNTEKPSTTHSTGTATGAPPSNPTKSDSASGVTDRSGSDATMSNKGNDTDRDDKKRSSATSPVHKQPADPVHGNAPTSTSGTANEGTSAPQPTGR